MSPWGSVFLVWYGPAHKIKEVRGRAQCRLATRPLGNRLRVLGQIFLHYQDFLPWSLLPVQVLIGQQLCESPIPAGSNCMAYTVTFQILSMCHQQSDRNLWRWETQTEENTGQSSYNIFPKKFILLWILNTSRKVDLVISWDSRDMR